MDKEINNLILSEIITRKEISKKFITYIIGKSAGLLVIKLVVTLLETA